MRNKNRTLGILNRFCKQAKLSANDKFRDRNTTIAKNRGYYSIYLKQIDVQLAS